jgi:hypothetical protein
MKTIKYIIAIVLLVSLSISCDSENQSIQQFYVDSEKSNDYLMLDIPTSLISLNDDASADAMQALQSIEKLNLLAFKLDDKNKDLYQSEKSKVKKILNDESFTELVRVKNNGSNIVVKYLGTEDAIEEVIVYASDNAKGFGLARLLGDDMKPENMLVLLESIKEMDKTSNTFKKLDGFFDGF